MVVEEFECSGIGGHLGNNVDAVLRVLQVEGTGYEFHDVLKVVVCGEEVETRYNAVYYRMCSDIRRYGKDCILEYIVSIMTVCIDIVSRQVICGEWRWTASSGRCQWRTVWRI